MRIKYTYQLNVRVKYINRVAKIVLAKQVIIIIINIIIIIINIYISTNHMNLLLLGLA